MALSVITVIYTALQVLDELWQGPLGEAFRQWYAQQKQTPAPSPPPTVASCRNFLTNKSYC